MLTSGVTVHVFVPNRHGTGTLVRLQRCTAVRKCGIHSVNMPNVKACFAKVYYSDSVIRSAALRRDVGYRQDVGVVNKLPKLFKCYLVFYWSLRCKVNNEQSN